MGTPVTTVLLVGTGSSTVVQPQPATGSCHAQGTGPYSEPDLRCTPGALNPAVSQVDLSTTICRSGYSASIRPSEDITEPEKRASMRAYGDTDSASDYEYDHDVSLELGGAANDARNLWPEPQGSPNPKDKLENKLHALVCSGQVPLSIAQHAIATDWVKAYVTYVGTAVRPVSRPTAPAPTATMTATPLAGVAITSIIDPVSPGSTEQATATSKAGDSCDLEITLPSGRQSTASGLGSKTTDGTGVASWSWTIGSNTDAGTASASLSCGAGRASRSFMIS